MIIPIAYLIFFTTSTVLAAKVATSEDMIFERIGKWAEIKVECGVKILDLVVCPWCMNTVFIFVGWGLIFLLKILPFVWDVRYIGVHLGAWFSCTFISGMCWTFYLTLNAKKDYYEQND